MPLGSPGSPGTPSITAARTVKFSVNSLWTRIPNDVAGNVEGPFLPLRARPGPVSKELWTNNSDADRITSNSDVTS